jgi:hypothetical protein
VVGIITLELQHVRCGNLPVKCGIDPSQQTTMFGILHSAGQVGLTTEEWNERARAAGLGGAREADLYDFREALKAKGPRPPLRGQVDGGPMTNPDKGYGSDTLRLPILGKPYRIHQLQPCRIRTVSTVSMLFI